MSKGLTEKRKEAIGKIKAMPCYHVPSIRVFIDRKIAAKQFAELAACFQEKLFPTSELNRITDALWEG